MIYNTYISTVLFQRQSFIKYNTIPGITSKKLWEGVLYWLIPLTGYILCLTLFTAFNPSSVGIFTFTMGIMLHPLISIPMAINAKWISRIICFIFSRTFENGERSQSRSICSNIRKRISSMTMVIYLAFIALIQWYVLYHWLIFKEDTINENCKNLDHLALKNCEKSFSTKHDFGSLLFNQCDCSGYGCVKAENINIERIFRESETSKTAALYFFIGYSVLMMLFFVVESIVPCFSSPIPMHIFLLGPQCQRKFENNESNPTRKNKVTKEMMSLTDMRQNNLDNNVVDNKKKISGEISSLKQNNILKRSLDISCIFAIILVISIFLIPPFTTAYRNFNEWINNTCPVGRYDSTPNQTKLICLGKF